MLRSRRAAPGAACVGAAPRGRPAWARVAHRPDADGSPAGRGSLPGRARAGR